MCRWPGQDKTRQDKRQNKTRDKRQETRQKTRQDKTRQYIDFIHII